MIAEFLFKSIKNKGNKSRGPVVFLRDFPGEAVSLSAWFCLKYAYQENNGRVAWETHPIPRERPPNREVWHSMGKKYTVVSAKNFTKSGVGQRKTFVGKEICSFCCFLLV